MREIAALVDPACFDMDPIAVSERMAEAGSPDRLRAADLWLCQLCAWTASAPHRLAFADIPVAGAAGPVGSALGGTGIAVSAFSQAQGCGDRLRLLGRQRRRCSAAPMPPPAASPAMPPAWEDPAVNAATGDFYKNTRATLEGAWVRPRHDGYMAFQQAASDRLVSGLTAGRAGRAR